MKQNRIINLLLVTIIMTSCGASEKKKEIEKQDALRYERAVKTYKDQEWGISLLTFDSLKSNSSYSRDAISYIHKIEEKQDSIYFEKACSFYKNEEWDVALTAYDSLKISARSKYGEKSEYYIKEIKNRPWQNTNKNATEAHILGSFSNSATKESPLWVDVSVHRNRIELNMYEYESSAPHNKSALKPGYDFSLSIMDHAGFRSLCRNVKPSSTGIVNETSHSEGITLYGKLARQIINSLKTGTGYVTIRIEMNNSSSYTMMIEQKGFKEGFNYLN